MNTKSITDRAERKKLKRAARKKAAPKAKRASGVARGSLKKKVKKMTKGQRKRVSAAAAVSRLLNRAWPRSSMNQLLRTKSIDALIAASEEPDRRLKKSLGVWSLIALGIGAVIGSGIFTVTGTAAAGEHFLAKSIFKAPVLDLLLNGGNAATLSGRLGAGPAISLSFVLVAIACGFAAICYAELASMIPIAGSAYTYSYATLGEIFAWIIGWDLILEYAVLQHERGGGLLGLFERPARQPVPFPSAAAALAAHL